MSQEEGKFKRFGKKMKIVLESATFALLLSIGFFAYEMLEGAAESSKIVENLTEIQNSLSTRYLGIFPEYIGSINELLEETVEDVRNKERVDSVIIFEDVLYYGILSDPKGFSTMIYNLLNLSKNGCHTIIAYYDPGKEGGLKRGPFQAMVKDKLISLEYQKSYRDRLDEYLYAQRRFGEERRNISKDLAPEEFRRRLEQAFDSCFAAFVSDPRFAGSQSKGDMMKNIGQFSYGDSVLCECCCDSTRYLNESKFNKRVERYLAPLPKLENPTDSLMLRVNEMCEEMDVVKRKYLDKPVKTVSYSDFYNMFRDMTNVVADLLSSCSNVRLVPLKENLMMSCWMSITGDNCRAIIAFPSKYSTDEIGFVSRDAAFSNYIRMMLAGIEHSN